jgi:hypothetical protein
LPVVGFISADGKSDHPEGQGRCTFPYALALCEAGDFDAFPYPYPLLKAMVDSIQDRGEYISVTSILHCLRGDFLKRTEPHYTTVEKLYPMFRGTLFHALLEANAPANAHVEEKRLRTHKGIELGGTFDSTLVFRDRVTKRFVIQDWKTTDNLPKYDSPYSSHIIQVNLYRWLLGLKPEDVSMEVHYFSMKGHKRCVLKDGTGPARGGRAQANQHWSDKQIESYLDDRLVKLKASFVTRVPLPYALVTEDEKWECAYCPVAQHCADLARLEAEAAMRRRAGLPPLDVNSPTEATTEWKVLLDGFTFRLNQAFPVAVPEEVVAATAPAALDAAPTTRRKRGS